jgi:hypothetical protein
MLKEKGKGKERHVRALDIAPERQGGDEWRT